MKKKHRVRVKIDGENHHVGVIEIDEDNKEVTINISSETVQVILGIGEDTKVDVTQDNHYNIYVLLNSIDKDSNEANLTIKSIYEEVPEDEQVGGTGEVVSEEGTDLEEGEDESESDIKKYVIWSLIIIGILLLVVGGKMYLDEKNNQK
ncbi:MAG: hypothetical protein ACOCUU_03605 [Nanoarchaeota archaeon]